jgi:hypothetical protein
MSAHPRLRAHRSQSVALTIYPPLDLKVILREHHPTIHTRKASWMELLIRWQRAVHFRRRGCFKILAFDAAVATRAKRAVGFVVMVLAVGLVVDDVKVCGREGLVAGATREALLMPAAGKTSIGGFDGFALDGFVAAAADGAEAWDGGTADGWRGTLRFSVW